MDVGATSLNYLHMALLPVLTSMFDHLGRNGFGSDLLGKSTQTNSINQSIDRSKSLINSCQTATEHIHMNCTNKNNDKMQ